MSTEQPRTVRGALEGGPAIDVLREVVIAGVATVVPLFVTLYVVMFLVGFLGQVVTPISTLLPIDSLVVAGGLCTLVLAAGVVARSGTGELLIDRMDDAIGRLPGVGAVYGSFRCMSDAVLENGAGNFSDVKLVEFPTEGTYTVAFETADAPESVRSAVEEEEMVLLFLPMAPNPVMGGYVVAMPVNRVYDVDMTMEEAFRTIVTSGVASDESLEERMADDGPGMMPVEFAAPKSK